MLGSIVSRLASPTQDGMKYPEMDKKKVKVRKKNLELKKMGEKNFKKNSENESCLKLPELPIKHDFFGEGGSCHRQTTEITE